MSGSRTRSRLIGSLVGLVLVVVAVCSVFLIDWRPKPPPEPVLVRPLKTMVIRSPMALSVRKYPGKVKAYREVALAFQVGGALIEFPVKKGQKVAKGELLARLDPRDYQHALDEAEAKLAEAKALWERMERLYKQGDAAKVEYEEHKRAFLVAKAAAEQARKNLAETYLRAPFAGLVADTFVENFQNVRAKQPILSLQNVEQVEIVIHVPQERVVRARRDKGRFRFVATFESLPGREFDVSLKEFSTEADPATQTFEATFVMPAPQDVLILPGMTVTIVETPRQPSATTQAVGFLVPADAVPVDSQGRYYVWRIEEHADGTGTVHRLDVEVGEMMGDKILVRKGLKQGDRIALAGVHLLQEGQRVRLFSVEDGQSR